MTNNPYYEEFTTLYTDNPDGNWHRTDHWLPKNWDDEYRAWAFRTKNVKRYSWAVPSPLAIAAIARYAPKVIELGAGTGYWAKLLRDAGVDVVAYDIQPYKNEWVDGRHFDVLQGDYSIVRKTSDRALMLCWTPMSNMAYTALNVYRGNMVIHIGEHYACTDSDEFFDQLERDWLEVEDLHIPQFWGLHDYLTIYRRKIPLILSAWRQR